MSKNFFKVRETLIIDVNEIAAFEWYEDKKANVEGWFVILGNGKDFLISHDEFLNLHGHMANCNIRVYERH